METRFYSATDLVNYLGCAHATVLRFAPAHANPSSYPKMTNMQLYFEERGFEHERAYLERSAQGRALNGG